MRAEVALADERKMTDDVQLEKDSDKGEHGNCQPLSQHSEPAVADFLAVEENDERGNDKHHVFEERGLVGHLDNVSETAAVLHDTEIVNSVDFHIFSNGKPQREEKEKGHENEIVPRGQLHTDSEQHHAAQHELASDGHHCCKKRQRVQEIHPEGDKIIVHRDSESHRIDGFCETGEQKQASQQDTDNF